MDLYKKSNYLNKLYFFIIFNLIFITTTTISNHQGIVNGSIVVFNTTANCYISGQVCDLGDSNNWSNGTLPKMGDDILIDYSNVPLVDSRPNYVNLLAYNKSMLSQLTFNSITLIGSSEIKTQLALSNVSMTITTNIKVLDQSTFSMSDHSRMFVKGQILVEQESQFYPSGALQISDSLSILNNSTIGFSGNKTQLSTNSFNIDEYSIFKVYDQIFQSDQPFLFVQGKACVLLGKLVIYFDSLSEPKANSEYKLIQVTNEAILNTTFTAGVQFLFDDHEKSDVKYQLQIENNGILTLEFHNSKLPLWSILLIILTIFIVVGLISIVIYIVNDRRKNKLNNSINNNNNINSSEKVDIHTPLIK
ncbi:hypothetical protein DICPUDRAFT_148842 [Dictyostelium purpureum]|uniref:Transmembrane protein n=1 Tax=Dictyostelium purpureum TaxID=5786 RepID=F0ZC55_DICPU|nr:uncharacterized protein DICPUDRAFT_148842 [Dictyostelium purpureum]EGC38436.1 hypothetical protein DICPUDRAFT_148842 [Dictyostelium purpureum]|eukprot:XP_003284994.1 hypothetical protein DICPUDRAFT_148842 [Dictyostelium purpureum]